jgi:hypothetical protein
MCFASGCSTFHYVLDWCRDGRFKSFSNVEWILSTSIMVHPFSELVANFHIHFQKYIR